MAGTIRITPEELREGARYLGDQEEAAMQALRNINDRIQAISAEWEGAAQSSFVSTFSELYNQISQALPQTIEGVRSMLNGAAKTMEETDTELSNALKM